jgi:hypothetical protein
MNMLKGIQNFQEQVQTKTDQELQDIYLNPENYQPVFIHLVTMELIKRNIPIEPLESIVDEKNAISDEKLELGKKGNIFWIIIFFTLIPGGGLAPILAGINYALSKTKNSQNEILYVYRPGTRKAGWWLLVLGSMAFLRALFYIIEYLSYMHS